MSGLTSQDRSVPNAINTNASLTTNVPLILTPGVKAVAIAAGNEHTMALRSDGTIVAWGRNVEGETSTSGLTPINASAIPCSVGDLMARNGGKLPLSQASPNSISRASPENFMALESRFSTACSRASRR